MKRLFANLALVAVLGVFVLPLAASLRGPDVPVCCLPGGKHHCLQHPAGTGPSFKIKTDACPYSPRFVATGLTGLHQAERKICKSAMRRQRRKDRGRCIL